MAEEMFHHRVSDEGDGGAGEAVGVVWGRGLNTPARTVIGSPPISNRNLTFPARRSAKSSDQREVSLRDRSAQGAAGLEGLAGGRSRGSQIKRGGGNGQK